MTDAGTTAETAPPEEEEPAQAGPPGGRNRDHPAAHSGGLYGLALGALGVAFGDIGTSPLYAVQTVFSIDDGAVKPTVADVYGVASLIFWAKTRLGWRETGPVDEDELERAKEQGWLDWRALLNDPRRADEEADDGPGPRPPDAP